MKEHHEKRAVRNTKPWLEQPAELLVAAPWPASIDIQINQLAAVHIPAVVAGDPLQYKESCRP
jgi:hypothetical protein